MPCCAGVAMSRRLQFGENAHRSIHEVSFACFLSFRNRSPRCVGVCLWRGPLLGGSRPCAWTTNQESTGGSSRLRTKRPGWREEEPTQDKTEDGRERCR